MMTHPVQTLRSSARAAGAACSLIMLAVLSGPPAVAQVDGTATPDAVQPAQALAFLLGEWEGTGWMLSPDGRRGEFSVRERVTPRASGYGVSLEGHGSVFVGPDQQERTVHDAFALIWAEPDGGFGMRTVVMQGHTLQVEPEITGNRLVWGFDAGPMGETRYTTVVEDGVWTATGERRLPGEADWSQFLEMTLTRMAAPLP